MQSGWSKGVWKKRFLHSSDVDAYKRRPQYASSQILQYMRERCTCPGTVYVAYVPPRMGKTTACVAHIERNGGLCFSPADFGKPFLQSMLSVVASIHAFSIRTPTWNAGSYVSRQWQDYGFRVYAEGGYVPNEYARLTKSSVGNALIVQSDECYEASPLLHAAYCCKNNLRAFRSLAFILDPGRQRCCH